MTTKNKVPICPYKIVVEMTCPVPGCFWRERLERENDMPLFRKYYTLHWNTTHYEPGITDALLGRQKLTRVQRLRRVQLIYERDGEYCFFCNKPLLAIDDLRIVTVGRDHPDYPTLEHFMPRCRGGTNGLDNLVVACQPCNNVKADRMPTHEEQQKHAQHLESVLLSHLGKE